MKTSSDRFFLAPVVVFAYKRVDTLQRTIEALAANFLAKDSDLIVFSDGPKKSSDTAAVNEVRNYLKDIQGFKSIKIIESPKNSGLATSIITGVSQVFSEHKRIIVIEDDVVTSQNFLNFMNEALEYYENSLEVFSISGWSIPIKSTSASDVYFTKRSNSACWASWSNRWIDIDWEVKDYNTFRKSAELQKRFNRMGSDMSGMLHRQMTGQIDSWAIRWCYHQFKNDVFTVYPVKSKSVNIGYDSPDASNTHEKYSRFETQLDDELKVSFVFPKEVVLERSTLKQFLRPHSLMQRAKYKLMNKFLR